MQGIGIIGCGRVGQRHMEVFRDELKGARVVIVCDKDLSKAAKFVEAVPADVTCTHADVLSHPDVSTVLILSESGNHAEHARAALEAGKHVIVEKPPAMLPDEVIELEQLAARKQLMYAVIFQNRYNPAMRQLKAAWEAGRFGRVTLATVRLRWCRYQDYYEDGWHGTWKMDGGVINQQAIHHIDALRWVCGEPKRVIASQRNAINQLEAEDTTVALVEFEAGFQGAIEATTAARPEDFEASISIIGEKGMVEIGGIALNQIYKWCFVDALPEDISLPELYSQEVPTGYGLSHGPLMQDIVDRLNRGELTPPITGSDTAKTVALVHAIYRSVEVDGWVNMADSPLSERLGR